MATGAFSPLDQFMGREDHQRVLDEMCLASGAIFPLPITLPVDAGAPVKLDSDIALRNSKNDLLAIMTVEEIYDWGFVPIAGKTFRNTGTGACVSASPPYTKTHMFLPLTQR